MRELATAMNCDPSYITAMIDDLERAGLATRRPSTTDRRVKTVVLTRRGNAALRTARRIARPTTAAGPADQGRIAKLARMLQQGLNLQSRS